MGHAEEFGFGLVDKVGEPMKDLRATERSHLIRFAFERIIMGNSSGWGGG